MKTLLLITFCFLDTLPPEQHLITSLDFFYQNQTQAELSEYQSTNQKQWLKYLPTIGLSYTINGKPRPTVSWSSNLIYTSQRNKERKEAKQKSIINKNTLKLQKDQLKLTALLQKYQALKEVFPDLPHYPVSEKEVKVPAGWLIEHAGFKGKTFNNYGVHKNQALVLVNYGGASGNDIYELSVLIQKTIKRIFDISLEAEVNIV